MTPGSITRKRVLLPLLLVAAVGTGVAGATAGQQPGRPPQAKDGRELMEEIRSGRAPEVPTPPGRQVRTTAVWNGCKFVFLTTKTKTYTTGDGGIAEVNTDPDPLPPDGPGLRGAESDGGGEGCWARRGRTPQRRRTIPKRPATANAGTGTPLGGCTPTRSRDERSTHGCGLQSGGEPPLALPVDRQR